MTHPHPRARSNSSAAWEMSTEHQEAAADRAALFTSLTDRTDALGLRTLAAPELAHAHPPASLDAEVHLAVEGVRPPGLVILDPRMGERVAL